MNIAILCKQLVTPLETIPDAVAVVREGRVERVGPRESVEIPAKMQVLDAPIVAPGFVDVHVHGAVGHDFMVADEDGFRRAATFLQQHGVTSFVPTTVTADRDRTLRALDFLGKRVRTNDPDGARAVGIHLEGPFISKEKAGVHPREHIVPPNTSTLAQMIEASAGAVRLLTIAPEEDRGGTCIREAVRRGVRVSIGHSNATYEQAIDGVAAGATHATHLFNAMREFNHRDPGIAGAVLTDTRVSAEMIVDGLHLHEATVRLVLEAKGPEKAVLVTDGVSATGMPDGIYKLGEFEVQVIGLRCERQGRLAGSVLTLDRAVRNLTRISGWPLYNTLRLATYNAAQVIGMETTMGSIHEGAAADLVVLTDAGEVIRTFVGGRELQA